ncbi:MAG TPA: TOBE-like domain-containing protein, partial [Bryobacteraceae bacterium]|nr:TOBE-like domain-containing protein [Bryobacteraceae bacterium]
NAVPAKVARIQTAGSLVKVELKTDTGEEALVEMPHEKLRELGIRKDDSVYIRLKQERVFIEDYSI